MHVNVEYPEVILNIKDVKGRFLYFYEYTEDEDIVVSPLYYNK